MLAVDVFANEPLPPFPASVKDGYAVIGTLIRNALRCGCTQEYSLRQCQAICNRRLCISITMANSTLSSLPPPIASDGPGVYSVLGPSLAGALAGMEGWPLFRFMVESLRYFVCSDTCTYCGQIGATSNAKLSTHPSLLFLPCVGYSDPWYRCPHYHGRGRSSWRRCCHPSMLKRLI